MTWRLSGRVVWQVCAVLALLLWAGVQAQAADRARLRAFLHVTGFDVALQSMAHSAQDAPKMLGMAANEFGADWTRTAQEVFDKQVLHEIALDILDQTLSDDLLATAAEFYATPLGTRLVAAENASHMNADSAAKQAEGAALVAGAAPGRLALLRRLTDAVDSAGVAVASIREVQVRFLVAASAAGVLERDIDAATLRRILAAGDDDLRAELRVLGLNGAAYTYREFTDPEIARYADALETPQMQRVYELMNAIHFEIMAERFEVLALRMADMDPGQAL